MGVYHAFQTVSIDPSDLALVERQYASGFVFTRRENTLMDQVKSVRVPLPAFALSSENRRVLKHFIHYSYTCIPRTQFAYHWHIGKMGKDFYARFGAGIFSANKIRELLVSEHSPITTVLEYRDEAAKPAGYCLGFETPTLFHYAFPFHTLSRAHPIGMAMMTNAVVWAKEQGKKYIYLGSIQNEKSLYKFQFKGVEWFDGIVWRTDKPKL